MANFLAVDLGTSAVKALVIDEQGRQVGAGSADCPIHQPEPSRQEQDPEEVFAAMRAAIAQAIAGLTPSAISAVGFSAAMHGFMPIGPDDQPLSRLWTWADGRAQAQALALPDRPGILGRTGCPATALYYPARIGWLKTNSPDLYRRAVRFASIRDLIVRRLTGRWVMDRSHASSNGLLDTRSLTWDHPLLDLLALDPAKMPDLIEPDEVAGTLLPGPAADLGLPPGIPIVPGAGDGGLANLGSGAVDPGQAAATIGTSGAARKVSSAPWTGDGRTWCYYLAERRWYLGGAINSGGIVLRWLRDGFLKGVSEKALREGRDPYDDITALAATVPPGAEGLVFLPYLFGERTPYWNPKARGMMFGLGPHHGPAHLARAALEAVCLCLAHVFESLAGSPGEVMEVRASGGFARSALWLQILADCLRRPVALPQSREGSALGAAVLTMKAAGAIKTIAAGREFAPVEKIFEPDPAAAAFYQGRFELFKDLYKRVEADFGRENG